MVSIHPTNNDIQGFWKWFVANANRLWDHRLNEDVHGELDAQLGGLGDVVWELGPGSIADHELAISPDGDPDLLPLAERIVAMAPTLPHWEFHAGRPAKPDPLKFSVLQDGEKLAIDARSWRYVLYVFPDKTVDLVLEQGGLYGISDEDRYTAAILLLDNLLGERKRLLLVPNVEPVAALEAELAKNASPITVLSEHLASLK